MPLRQLESTLFDNTISSNKDYYNEVENKGCDIAYYDVYGSYLI